MSLSLLNLLLKEIPDLKNNLEKSSNKNLKNNTKDFHNILISILDENLKNFNNDFKITTNFSQNLLQINLQLESNLNKKVNLLVSNLKALLSKQKLSVNDLNLLESYIKSLLNILKNSSSNISFEDIFEILSAFKNFILSNIEKNEDKNTPSNDLKNNNINFIFNFENAKNFIESFQKYFDKKNKLNIDKIKEKSKTKNHNYEKKESKISIWDTKKDLINFLNNFLSAIQSIKMEFLKQKNEIAKRTFNQIDKFNKFKKNNTDITFKHANNKSLDLQKNKSKENLLLNNQKSQNVQYKEKQNNNNVIKERNLEKTNIDKDIFLLNSLSNKIKKENKKNEKFSQLNNLNNKKINNNSIFSFFKKNSYQNIQKTNQKVSFTEIQNLPLQENKLSLENTKNKNTKLKNRLLSLKKKNNLFSIFSKYKKKDKINILPENLNNFLNSEKSLENYISNFSQRKININLSLKKTLNIEKSLDNKQDLQNFDSQKLKENMNNKTKSLNFYNVYNSTNKSYNNQNINFENNLVVGKTNFVITETKYPNLRVLNVYQNQENLMKVRYHLATGELSLILKVENMPPVMLSIIKKEIENVLDVYNLTKRKIKIKNENKEKEKEKFERKDEKGLFKVI